jgi:hypothetical protein
MRTSSRGGRSGLSNNLHKDESLQNQNHRVLNGVYRSLLYQPPTFNEDLTDDTRFLLETGTGAAAGDQAALQNAAALQWNDGVVDNSGIFRFLIGVASRLNPNNPVLDSELSTSMVEGYRPGTQEYKAYQWMRSQVQMSSEATGWQRSGAAVGGMVAGIVANIVAARVIAAPILGAANLARSAGNVLRMGVRGSLGSVAANNIGGTFASWVVGRAIPEGVESLIDATAITGSRLAANDIESGIPRFIEPRESALANIAIAFGSDFVQDLLIFGALSVVGNTIGAAARGVFRGRGFSTDAIRKATADTPEMFDQIMDDLAGGKWISKETADALHPDLWDNIVEARRVIEAGNRLNDMSPEEAARMVALHRGYELRKVDGGWQLRSAGADVPMEGTFNSPESAVWGLFRRQTETTGEAFSEVSHAARRNEFIVREQVSGMLDDVPDMDLDRRVLADALLRNADGSFDEGRIRAVVQDVMRKAGRTPDEIAEMNTRVVSLRTIRARLRAGTLPDNEILVPRKVNTLSEMGRWEDAFETQMSKVIGDNPKWQEYTRMLIRRSRNIPDTANLAYGESVAKSLGLEYKPLGGGKIQIGDVVYNNVDEANASLYWRKIRGDEGFAVIEAKRQLG